MPKSVARTSRPRTAWRSRSRPPTPSHGSPSSAFRLSETRPLSSSTLRTFTVTASPTCKRSPGRATRTWEISEIGTRPWMPPRSTKAPKSASEATVPGSTAPGTIFCRVTSAASAASSSSS